VNDLIGTSGAVANVARNRLLPLIVIRPIRSKSTWPRNATNRSGIGWPFLTKYTLPFNGFLSNGVSAVELPCACAHLEISDSSSARVHASLIVFNRALIVAGSETRTNVLFA
jgi:hypothetical protein